MLSTPITLLFSFTGATLAGTGLFLLRLGRRGTGSGSGTKQADIPAADTETPHAEHGSRSDSGRHRRNGDHHGGSRRRHSSRSKHSRKRSKKREPKPLNPAARKRRAYGLLVLGALLLLLPWLLPSPPPPPEDPDKPRPVNLDLLLDQPVPPGGLPFAELPAGQGDDPASGGSGRNLLILVWATPSPLDAASLLEIQVYSRQLAVLAADVAKANWPGANTDIRLLSRIEFKRLQAQPKALIDWCDSVPVSHLIVLGLGPHKNAELNLNNPRSLIMELHDCLGRRSVRDTSELVRKTTTDSFLYEHSLTVALRALVEDGFGPKRRKPAPRKDGAKPAK